MQRGQELGKGLLYSLRPVARRAFDGLDPGARIDLWQYLDILCDEAKVTVLVTTHLMEQAGRCDRLAFLNEGKLVALGTPLELQQDIGGDVSCSILKIQSHWRIVSGYGLTRKPM